MKDGNSQNNSIELTKLKHLRRRRKRGRALLSCLLVSSVVIWLFGLSGCIDRCLYCPKAQLTFGPTPTDYQYDEVFFESEPGVRLRGYFAHPNQQLLRAQFGEKPKGTIVHVHGNAGDIESHLPITAFLVRSGYQVLVFDYRGYGGSTGNLSRAGTLRDTLAAIDYVKSRSDVDAEKTFLFGQSLGGAVAVVAAAQRPELRGLVIESAFTTYRVAFKNSLKQIPVISLVAPLAALMMKHGLDPIDYIDRISAPLLFIHGERDVIIPLQMTKTLYAKANEPKDLKSFKGMVHIRGDIYLGSEYTNTILSFLDKLIRADAGQQDLNRPDKK